MNYSGLANAIASSAATLVICIVSYSGALTFGVPLWVNATATGVGFLLAAAVAAWREPVLKKAKSRLERAVARTASTLIGGVVVPGMIPAQALFPGVDVTICGREFRPCVFSGAVTLCQHSVLPALVLYGLALAGYAPTSAIFWAGRLFLFSTPLSIAYAAEFQVGLEMALLKR